MILNNCVFETALAPPPHRVEYADRSVLRTFISRKPAGLKLAIVAALAFAALIICGCPLETVETPKDNTDDNSGDKYNPQLSENIFETAAQSDQWGAYDSLGTSKIKAAQSDGGTLTITSSIPSSTENRYVEISGTINNSNANGRYAYIDVLKSDDKVDGYVIRGRKSDGAFTRKIYFRYGSGQYQIRLWRPTRVNVALSGNGYVFGWGALKYKEYTVDCTSAVATADDWMLMPSGTVRIDQALKNLSDTICAGKSSAADKVRAINKWIVTQSD